MSDDDSNSISSEVSNTSEVKTSFSKTSSKNSSKTSQTSSSKRTGKTERTSKSEKSERPQISKNSSSTLPRVATLRTSTPECKISLGNTLLPSGEKITKSHKCLLASGSIEETIGLIGRLKSYHFTLEEPSARKMFIFARLTKIQEDLFGIIKSITTTPVNSGKYSNSRFSSEKVKELEDAILALNSKAYKGIPGSSTLESDIYVIWAVVRRCERQVINARDPSLGIVVEENVIQYMNKLSEYFSHLIKHTIERF